MSITEQYYEAIADYGGVEGDVKFLRVEKVDVVRLIKKKHKYLKVSKDGHIGKVPKRILVQKMNQISQNKMNSPIQNIQHSPQIMNQMKTQNGNSQIKTMNPIDKQKSQIIHHHQKQQIKQQSDNLLQSFTNIKSQSGSGSTKQEIKQKAISKYQLDHLHQIIQDIHSIIESNTTSYKKKERKIKKNYNELKKKDLNELRKIFNIDAFILIQKYINDCRTRIEKILLDIIELVTERGIQYYNDTIFDDIQSSGLLTKYEQMIKENIEKEKEQKKYSIEVEQLIRIYIKIMKRRQLNQQMIDIYVQVIDKKIINLLITINKLKENDNKGNKNKQSNEEIERKLKQSAQLIKIILLIRDKYNIPYQIINIMKDRICQLIHLNCTTDIICKQCINIPQSPALIQLRYVLFQTLFEVSYNQEFQNMLVKHHNIITHLIQLLIQFASQSQLGKQIESQKQHNQQLQESSSSLSLIASTLIFLQNLIDNYKKRKDVIMISNALYSLTILTSYKHGIHFSQQYDELTYQIRHSSKICLRQNHFQIIISENKASNVSIRINAAQMYRLTIGKLCILNLQDALQIMGRHLE